VHCQLGGTYQDQSYTYPVLDTAGPERFQTEGPDEALEAARLGGLGPPGPGGAVERPAAGKESVVYGRDCGDVQGAALAAAYSLLFLM
jgi:hypothetical protein